MEQGQDRSSARLPPSPLDLPRFFAILKLSEDLWFDIIVGDEPNETLRITGYFFHLGNIIVINDADFNLDGMIIVSSLGKAIFDSGQIKFHQHYIYHHGIILSDSAYKAIMNSTTSFNGYPMGIGIAGETEINLNDVFQRRLDHRRSLPEWKGAIEIGRWLYW
jgi:hypothetical protein